MPINGPARRLESVFDRDRRSHGSAEPLGRVVSVGGSQVIVEFSTEMLSARRHRAHRRRLSRHLERTYARGRVAVRHLARTSSPTVSRARPRPARVDLLGELVLDEPGARLFPARRHDLSRRSAARSCRSATTSCASSSTPPARTRSMSGTCSRTPRSAPISTSTTWCASTSPSSAAPAPASRARSR